MKKPNFFHGLWKQRSLSSQGSAGNKSWELLLASKRALWFLSRSITYRLSLSELLLVPVIDVPVSSVEKLIVGKVTSFDTFRYSIHHFLSSVQSVQRNTRAKKLFRIISHSLMRLEVTATFESVFFQDVAESADYGAINSLAPSRILAENDNISFKINP